MVSSDKLHLINEALDEFGGSAKTGKEGIPNLKIIPTGIPLLDDHVLGVGGFPLGRAVEVSGKPSCGKTTLCQWFAGLVQKNGLVWWADVEGTMTKKYAQGSGMNLDQMIFPELGTGEDVLAKIKLALAINKFDIIVVDSIGATKSAAHSLDNMNTRLASAKMWADFWDSIVTGYEVESLVHKGLIKSNVVVKTLSEGKLKISDTTHKLAQKNTCLICINHLMPKIGVMFGEKTRTSGGDKKDFVFSVRLRVSLVKTKKNSKGELQYKLIKVENKKNKVGIPLRACQLKMYPDGRIEGDGEVAPSYEKDDGPSGINPADQG